MPAITLLHGSDLHFGKLHDPVAADAFLRSAHDLAPDLIVLSGDFTQRAKRKEYLAARGYLAQLPRVPIVVTPGNHDVPLYRVAERILSPYRNYREYIAKALDAVTRIPGVTAVALNSAAPRRAIVNGRIGEKQIEFARAAFRSAPAGDLRVVVTHHHLAPAPDYEGDHPLPGARKVLDALERMGVDLILGGHLHRAYIGNSLDVHPGPDRDRGIVIVQSGTTTSKRGRARERAKNSFNLIRVEPARLEVTHYMGFREAKGFAPLSRHLFPRAPRRWFESEIAGEVGPLDKASGTRAEEAPGEAAPRVGVPEGHR